MCNCLTLQVFGGSVLVVGQRTDVAVQNRVLYRPESVHREVSIIGQLHMITAMDYFAIARNRFPWERVPDLIIGHTFYDNFMVEIATECNVSVVDATETLTALHQTDTDGNEAGLRRSDNSYNKRTLGNVGQWLQGCRNVKCIEFQTKWLVETVELSDFDDDAVLQKRRRIFVERREIPNNTMAAAVYGKLVPV